MINILDKGYVRLVDHMGSDLSAVNAARASYAKESDGFSAKDEKLLKFLVKHGHMSPFRHAFATIEVKAPLMVARQWWKYVVGSDHTMDGWNEASRRYITMEPEFYIPMDWEWRSAPANSKQGSGDNVPVEIGQGFTDLLVDMIDRGLDAYNRALAEGIAPEQARLLLPAYGMYTIWRWSASIQSLAHFLNQRIADDAQKEIQLYAIGVRDLLKPYFPVTIEAFKGE